MSALARWCHRHRLLVLFFWVGTLAALAVSALTAGAAYRTDVKLPNSESATALKLLQQHAPNAAGTSGQIVWHTDTGSVTASPTEQQLSGVLAQIEQTPGVTAVSSPYDAKGAGQISKDGQTAFATVTFQQGLTAKSPEVTQVEALAQGVHAQGLNVQLGGGAFTQAPAANELTEIVGVVIAGLVLYLMFRSAAAAVLPLLTGVAGVGAATFATMLLSHVVTLSDTTPTLGALIGLGVGIDYALFIVNRQRRAQLAGLSVQEATARALGTSGRAVVFAGLTVVIALLGMLTLGIGLLNGMAIGAALTVTITVLAAVTLLPALLGLLGPRVLSRKQRRALLAGEHEAEEPVRVGAWGRWATRLQKRPRVFAAASLLVLIICALPVLSLRLGAADAGNNPPASSSRQAYDLLAQGFGPGFNGPLVLSVELPDAQAHQALTTLEDNLRSTPGVASVASAPVLADQTFAVVQVVLTTSPQSEQTSQLITELRDHAIPAAETGSGLKVYVGGTTAVNDDFANTLVGKLPLFIGIITVLGFLLLTLAFRSLLIPLIGAVTNVLTLGVALGAIVVVFQHGIGTGLLGVGSAGPVETFVPILVIGVMFGLSMDYQVFLVSRMHEEWTHTRDTRRAVRVGQAETGQVIATAATIMFVVFASFVMGGMRVIAEFGLGLAVAVLLDAFVVRLVLVPALLHLFGRASWWLPRWLDRLLPRVSVEGAAEPDEDLGDQVVALPAGR